MMRLETVVREKVPTINPLFFGYENNPNLKKRHPIVRSRIFVHYVKRGKGYLETQNNLYKLKPGEVFLIMPGNSATYWADNDDPWELIWISFEGSICADFMNLPPVFGYSGEIFEEIRKAIDAEGRRDILVTHLLFKWYYEIFPDSEEPKGNYVDIAKEYIDNNYMLPIRVSEIAKTVYLDRTYLLRLFKESMGMTLQEYILSVRLKQARILLAEGKKVTETAMLCGFSSQSHFSKAFKKFYGYPPKVQKQKNQ